MLHEHAAKLLTRGHPGTDPTTPSLRAIERTPRCSGASAWSPSTTRARWSRTRALRARPGRSTRAGAAGRLPLRVAGSIRSEQIPRAIELGLRMRAEPERGRPGRSAIRPTAAAVRDGLAEAVRRRRAGIPQRRAARRLRTRAGGGRRSADRRGCCSQPDGRAGRAARVALPPPASRSRSTASATRRCAPRSTSWRRCPPRRRASATASSMRSWSTLTMCRGSRPSASRPRSSPATWPRTERCGAVRVGRALGRRLPAAVARRAGARSPSGTDAPVESPDPWPGLAIAVTRAGSGWPDAAPLPPRAGDRPGRGPCVPRASSRPLVAGETDRGRLVAGHRADLIVVPAAALDEPPSPGRRVGVGSTAGDPDRRRRSSTGSRASTRSPIADSARRRACCVRSAGAGASAAATRSLAS